MTEPIIAKFMLPITTKETVEELMQQGCNWGKTIGAIAELEKIKAEIEEIKGLRDNPYNKETEYSVSTKELREILDKHIAELKGKTE